jgi:hypothetical protein
LRKWRHTRDLNVVGNLNRCRAFAEITSSGFGRDEEAKICIEKRAQLFRPGIAPCKLTLNLPA